MKNLNEYQKKSQSVFLISKFKWAFISIGCLLVISILLNFLLYFNGIDSILNETHKFDKKIKKSGITWVGIKTTPSDETTASNYELWRIGEGCKAALSAYSHIQKTRGKKGGVGSDFAKKKK